jgi:hypothetical protein
MTVPVPRNTTVRRVPRRTVTPLLDFDKDVHEFLFNWGQAKDAGTLRDRAKDRMKKWFAGNGDAAHEITVNENGSQAVEFEQPLTIGGRTFRGVENRRTATSYIDPDLVDEWLDELPQAEREELSKRLLKREVVYTLQLAELYALNQEGVIPDKTLDGFTKTDVQWAMNVLLA